MEMFDPAKKYFDPSISERERAIFESGIALGYIFHQFIGIPLIKDKKFISNLEKTIEDTVKVQPFRENVKVKIKTEKIREKTHPYSYTVIKPGNIEAKVEVKYGKTKVTSKMNFIPELSFPLMYIENIEETE